MLSRGKSNAALIQLNISWLCCTEKGSDHYINKKKKRKRGDTNKGLKKMKKEKKKEKGNKIKSELSIYTFQRFYHTYETPFEKALVDV
jgi:hypothetical protein